MIVPLLITVDPIVFLFSMFQVILCFDHSKIAKVITFFENLKNITKIFREKKKTLIKMSLEETKMLVDYSKEVAEKLPAAKALAREVIF